MALDREQAGGVAPMFGCGSYTLGHDVHFIQARLSRENGPGEPRVVASVDDDGTITFTDGTSVWNHDPECVRATLARVGTDVLLRSPGVLAIPEGVVTRCFSVAPGPDPCRPETGEVRPGESILDELLRRGGLIRPIDEVKAEIDHVRQTPRDDEGGEGRSPQGASQQ